MKTPTATNLILALSVSFSFSCILDNPVDPEPGLYYCETDSDCTLSRYYCDTVSSSCVSDSAPLTCVDNDEDGYGIGDDRTECRFPEEDTDDTDAAIFPNAPDICDTKDNDSDGRVDEPLPCDSSSDCPQIGVPNGSFFRCDEAARVCVLKPSNTIPDGCDIELACIDGEYQSVPPECS